MKAIKKPEDFELLASEVRSLDQQLLLLQKQRDKLLTSIGSLFTTWKIGNYVTISTNKKKSIQYLIFNLSLYSDHHIRENEIIYDEQYIVKVSLIPFSNDKAKWKEKTVLLLHDGTLADNKEKLISHQNNKKDAT